MVSISRPKAPVGSLILIPLLYLPWLRYFLGPHPAPSEGDGLLGSVRQFTPVF